LWDEFHQPHEPEGENEWFQTARGESVVDTAIALLGPDTEQFLYVQLWDPHEPYKRTDDQIEPFQDGLEHEYSTAEKIEEQLEWDAWRSATHIDISDRDDLAKFDAQYDAEIRYADRQIGRLVRRLKELDCYDETMIVVTGDHSEEFGEHGLYQEHWSTHDGTQRVPLIMKPPASLDAESGVRDHLVTNVDIAPTLADVAGLDTLAKWQGHSLVPILQDVSTDSRDEIVFDHGLYTAQRAVRTDRWKLILTFNPGMWGGVVPEEQLFDMDDDPWEQRNVATDHLDVVADLKDRISAWESEYLGEYGDALRTVAEEGPSGYVEFASDFDGV
jgi:arylsulfatase A-like enzyme